MRAAARPTRWLPNETVIAVEPPPSAAAAAGWRRRIRAFAGRSLSHLALRNEQEQRGGRLALRGQLVSPGVVFGFEVDFDRVSRTSLRVAAGYGLTASGEDVSLRSELELAPADLLVWGTRNAEDPKSADLTLGELPLRARVLALVLQPVEILAREGGDPEDACENDPAADAFADHQRVDATMPIWVELPESFEAIARSVTDATMRNRLVHAIFKHEIDAPKRDLGVRSGEELVFPWESVGVPIALVGLDDRGLVRFVDRHALTRAGGKARRRSAVLLQEGMRGLWTGAPALWQARIDQLSEHLLDLVVMNRLEPGMVYKAFAFAPPAGILPLDLVRALPEPTRSQRFFPEHAVIEWMPIPVEQLDATIAASASLARFDFSRRFLVRLLVPVPQSLFEPRVLLTESPSQPLLDAKARIELVLAQKRYVRDRTFEQRQQLEKLLDGSTTLLPIEPEASAVETAPLPPEATPSIPPSTSIEAEIEAFQGEVDRLAGGNARERVMASLRDAGLRGARKALASLTDKTDDTIDFGFLRMQAEIYRVRQIMVGNQAATHLAASPALASIVQGSTAFAGTRELEAVFAKAPRTRTPPPPRSPREDPNTPPAGPAAEGPASPLREARPRAAPSARAEAIVADRARAAALPMISMAPPITAFAAPTDKTGLRMAASLARKKIRLDDELPFPIDETIKDEITSRPAFETPGIERTVSIAERLPESASTEARASAKASKYGTLDAMRQLADIGLHDVVVSVPEVLEGKPTGKVERRPLNEVLDKLGDLSKHETAVGDASDDVEGATLSDEARHLSVGVRLVDDTIALLRQIEVKAANLRHLITLTDARITRLETERGLLATRLVSSEKGLLEARHDYAVALALVAEDAARVAATNERRKQVLRDHARFVAFVRPRSEDLADDTPARDLESPEEMPVPACFREEIGFVPPEIRQAVDMVRRAPLRWLPPYHRLLDALDDQATLAHLVRSTITFAPLTMMAKAASAVRAEAVPIVRGLEAGFASMDAQLAERDEQLRAFDTERIDQLPWSTLRDEAQRFVTFADFSHVGHLRPELLQGASLAVDRLTRVATCLYRRFAEAPPDLRLAWAQQLSVHDAAVGLRDLLSLHRFHELPPDDREGMQALVDWLYAQVAPLPRPRVMMDNLVRICALLASHAPVRALLRGTIARTTIQLGQTVRIKALDLAEARIGMGVLVGKTALARGVVEDIGEGFVTARIVATSRPSLELADDTDAFLAEPEQLATTAAKVLAIALP